MVDASTLYVGTYTRNTTSQGIYSYRFEAASGGLSPLEATEGVGNPSFLCAHPRHPVIYAVNEVRDYRDGSGGSLSVFTRHDGGRLELIAVRATRGADPCHVALDPAGDLLAVANYSSGSFVTFQLDERGRIVQELDFIQHQGSSVDPRRQAGPHAHSVWFHPTVPDLFVVDLGLDKVFAYPLVDGRVKANECRAFDTPPGSGPRHLAFMAEGRMAAVFTELSNEVIVCDVGSGKLVGQQSLSSLPQEWNDASFGAHVAISANGQHLYGTNRGHDSVFHCHVSEGRLTWRNAYPSMGGHPRHFTLSPDERHLLVANRDSNNVVVFARNPDDGSLQDPVTQAVPAPVCLVFA